MKRRRWAVEVAVLLALYAAYSLVRSVLDGSEALAADNARRVVSLERAIGLLHERSVQQLLDSPSIIRPLNSFYSLAHFSVTAAVMVWLFLRRESYPRRRTAIVATTCLALVGYALFPLMPPRLYPDDGIVDTLAIHGAPWTYSGGTVGDLSNQFAAMPSLHVAWALWCTWVVWQEARRRWMRAVAVAYSALAVVTVIATGNHYVLDLVGAAVVLVAGVAIGNAVAASRGSRQGAPPQGHAPGDEPVETAAGASSGTGHDLPTPR